MEKRCVLDESKLCDECGECNRCDLNPDKICDNCMACLRTGAEYNAIEIDEVIDDGSGREAYENLRRMLDAQDALKAAKGQKDEDLPEEVRL